MIRRQACMTSWLVYQYRHITYISLSSFSHFWHFAIRITTDESFTQLKRPTSKRYRGKTVTEQKIIPLSARPFTLTRTYMYLHVNLKIVKKKMTFQLTTKYNMIFNQIKRIECFKKFINL